MSLQIYRVVASEEVRVLVESYKPYCGFNIVLALNICGRNIS